MQAMPPAFGRAIDLSALRTKAESSSPVGTATTAAADQGAFVIDITEANFAEEVVKRSTTVPVILDFWAEWCEPCKQLSPILEELAQADAGAWMLAKVDIEANKQLAAAFAVQSIPMVAAFVAGQPVDAFTGVVPKPQLRQWLDAVLAAGKQAGLTPPPAAAPDAGPHPGFAAAEAAIAAKDYPKAKAALEEVLAAEPGNADATARLALVELLSRVADVDLAAAIAAADAAPGDVAAAITAADAQAAAGDTDAAFDRLVELVSRSSGGDQDRARTHLLELFSVVPPTDDGVRRARRALANALF